MKRFTNVKSGGVILTLLLLALVSGSVWGQEVVDELTVSDLNLPNNGYGNFSGISKTSEAKYAGNAYKDAKKNAIQLKSKEGSGIVSTKSGGKKVKSVSVVWTEASSLTGTTIDVYGKTSAYSSAEDLYGNAAEQGTKLGSIVKGESTTIEVNGGYKYVGLRSNKNALQIDKVIVVWDNGEVTQVAKPELLPGDGTSFIDKLTVTASCSTDGATIYYTTDGAEPTSSSEKFPEDGLLIDKTTTVKVMAANGTLEDSEMEMATYTKTEGLSIADFKALESGTSDQILKLDNVIVTAVGDRDIFVQDAEGNGIDFYLSNQDYKVGDVLGGYVIGTYKVFNKMPELTEGDYSNVRKVSEGLTIPKVVTVVELEANPEKYYCSLVEVEHVVYKEGNFVQGDDPVAFYDKFNVFAEDYGWPSVMNVTGIFIPFNDKLQISPRYVDDVQNVSGVSVPTFVWSTPTLTVELGQEDISYPVLENTSNGEVFYESSNKEVATITNTGEIELIAAGTTIIKASVAETAEYVSASASYTLTVMEPGAVPVSVAIVAEDEGVYYAMANTQETGDERLDAVEVDVLNGKVVNSGNLPIGWFVDRGNGTIKDAETGKYVEHKGGTKIDLSDKTFKWNWNGKAWISSEDQGRALEYNKSGYFRAYDPKTTSEITAVDMSLVNGYARDIQKSDYGTICLPYAVAAEDMAGAEFFSIAGKVLKDGEPQSIVLEQVTTLEAGVPYIFSATSDKLIAAYSGKAVAVAEEANGLIGSFEGQDVAEGMYLISAQNKVQLCGKSCKISGNRAYIDMNEVPEYSGEVGVNQRLISFEDATGISETMVEGGLADVYTLSGVEIRHQVNESEATQGLPQGIYIVNGKKVVVK